MSRAWVHRPLGTIDTPDGEKNLDDDEEDDEGGKVTGFDTRIYGSVKTHGSPRTGWQVVRPELAPLPLPLRPPLSILLAPLPRPSRPSFPHRLHLLSWSSSSSAVAGARRSGKPIKTRQVHSPGPYGGSSASAAFIHHHSLSLSFLLRHASVSIRFSSFLSRFAASSCSSASRVPLLLLSSVRRRASRRLALPFLFILRTGPYCLFDSSVKPCLTVICSHIVSTILSRRMKPRKRMFAQCLCANPVPIRIPVVASLSRLLFCN